MNLPNPLPQTLREAVWQFLLVILFATRLKDIIGFCRRLWTAFRESSSTARLREAEAHKTDAEAGAIEASTAIGLLREMRVTMNEAAELRDQLQSKIASKDSTIELLKVKIEEMERAHPEDVRDNSESAG